MPAAAKATTRRKRNNKRAEPKYRRRTFMFDDDTEHETELVRLGIRATTASEAVRYAVRKIAEEMQHVKNGGKIYVDGRDKKTVVLDIPAAP